MTATPSFATNRKALIELAARYRLPAAYSWREFVVDGGLISFGVNLDAMFSNAAFFVDKILKGADPANLSVERPNKFDLLVNSKTAKALGITIPRSVLLRATEVID